MPIYKSFVQSGDKKGQGYDTDKNLYLINPERDSLPLLYTTAHHIHRWETLKNEYQKGKYFWKIKRVSAT